MKHIQKKITKEEQQTAYTSASIVKKMLEGEKTDFIQMGEIKFPIKALSLFNDILEAMAEGKSVTLFSDEKQELSTQEVADMLHVSRPYIVKLIEKGEIKCKKIGKHRRITLKEALVYKDKMQNIRQENLKRLAEEAQILNLGY